MSCPARSQTYTTSLSSTMMNWTNEGGHWKPSTCSYLAYFRTSYHIWGHCEFSAAGGWVEVSGNWLLYRNECTSQTQALSYLPCYASYNVNLPNYNQIFNTMNTKNILLKHNWIKWKKKRKLSFCVVTWHADVCIARSFVCKWREGFGGSHGAGDWVSL